MFADSSYYRRVGIDCHFLRESFGSFVAREAGHYIYHLMDIQFRSPLCRRMTSFCQSGFIQIHDDKKSPGLCCQCLWTHFLIADRSATRTKAWRQGTEVFWPFGLRDTRMNIIHAETVVCWYHAYRVFTDDITKGDVEMLAGINSSAITVNIRLREIILLLSKTRNSPSCASIAYDLTSSSLTNKRCWGEVVDTASGNCRILTIPVSPQRKHHWR